MAFGDRLKQLREAAGLTQAALADKSGVPIGTVRDYEQGRREPSFQAAEKLAGAIGVKLEALSSGTAKKPAASVAPKRKRKGA